MSQNENFNTPMMQQYMRIKGQYPDAILFFRLGDFYEMFLEDAKIGSKVLGITLTSRDKGKDGKIPMAGVPYHAAESYIQKLIKNGYKVAICEQVTEPTKGKELVEREVIRVVTPSTILSESDTDSITTDYLMTFVVKNKELGVALVSVKSGTILFGQEISRRDLSDTSLLVEELIELIERYQPTELLLPPLVYDQPNAVRELFQKGVSPFRYRYPVENINEAKPMILEEFRLTTLESIGAEHKTLGILALANALEYIQETQKAEINFLRLPQPIFPEGNLVLTGQTIRNLEIFGNVRQTDFDLSLFSVLNNTTTPMGNRLLHLWLLRPLATKDRIEERYAVVQWFIDHSERQKQIRQFLEVINDLERMISRIAVRVGNGRDLLAIRNGLFAAMNIKEQFKENSPKLIQQILSATEWVRIQKIVDLIDSSISEDPPITITEGGIIKSGYSAKLDEVREIARGGYEWLQNLEKQEQESTGINNLKIGFNNVSGYYIEISKGNLDKVPMHYVRRQTLTNGERFIIPELKDHEDKVLSAQSEADGLEIELFREIVLEVMKEVTEIQHASELIAYSDVLCGFAELAVANNYTCPLISTNAQFVINNGRHPVVEQVLKSGFVGNNTNLSDELRMMIITGANMAGKSTYIRQVALLAIMAQIGSFVPADEMEFGLFTEIHTRIGAMDNLTSGLSTFMVEMVETAAILNSVTDRSLVILDEIGRGTSTYDGLSIAWAISEFLLQHTKAKILFATHYHELTDLTINYSHAQNFHLAVSNENGEVVFLYKVKPGKASQSFGIEVAKRAGLPKEVIGRAIEILSDLNRQSNAISPVSAKQLGLFTELNKN